MILPMRGHYVFTLAAFLCMASGVAGMHAFRTYHRV